MTNRLAIAMLPMAFMACCGGGAVVSSVTPVPVSQPAERAPSEGTPNWAATATIPNYAATAEAQYPQAGTPWPAIDAGKVYPTVGPIQRIDTDPLVGTP
jgi:hypothetical protein